jgi:cytochrome c
MTAAEGTWNDEDLFFFLAKPSKFMPGTKMSFVGLRKPQDVANVITYLKEKAG